MYRSIPEFSLYEMDENKVIRHVKTKNIKSPHRGGSSVRLYAEDGKELSRKIDKLYNLTFPESIPGKLLEPFSSYRILDTGEIYSIYEAKLLKPAKSKDGYLQVSLKSDDGGVKSELVHRLVARAYLSNPDSRPDINHIDGVKTNNSVDNLEWCDKSHNMQHAYDKELKIPRKKKCKLTSPEGFVTTFSCLADAADYLGLAPGAVNYTVRRNARGEVPTKGYGKSVGKYTCKGHIAEYI